jgi:uncharacterized membrane protein YedE/YeeE
MLFDGRIAGISGILAHVLNNAPDKSQWRWFFLVGLMSSSLCFNAFFQTTPADYSRSSVLIIISGFLVGIGTRLGSGCTSGHAVCGLARLSKRSFIATLIFMSVAFFTVYVTQHLVGIGI